MNFVTFLFLRWCWSKIQVALFLWFLQLVRSCETFYLSSATHFICSWNRTEKKDLISLYSKGNSFLFELIAIYVASLTHTRTRTHLAINLMFEKIYISIDLFSSETNAGKYLWIVACTTCAGTQLIRDKLTARNRIKEIRHFLHFTQHLKCVAKIFNSFSFTYESVSCVT